MNLKLYTFMLTLLANLARSFINSPGPKDQVSLRHGATSIVRPSFVRPFARLSSVFLPGVSFSFKRLLLQKH